ncbi:ABC transporter substrate-binding protein [Frankia tisae]|uniref:ABC transporter substrate-binding protein n=1 Tax=Frankia tisae TaxID=2950104 RepID=UPI0021BE46BB|nr:ABC transporter substrate-binding protein [Frankia tisae]
MAAAALSGILALLFTSCSSGSASTTNAGAGTPATSTTRTVTDSTGKKVTVPATINRIADGWSAHNEIVHMLGSGDKIIATSLTPDLVPWFYKINPTMQKAKTLFRGTTVNTEEVLQARPDMLFTSTGTQDWSKITAAGIPVAQLTFQTFDGLKSVVNTTAKALGPAAEAQASRYNSYLDSKISQVRTKTAPIPADKRPKVLHVQSLNPLTVDGTNTIIDQWITLAGGRNAAQVSGNGKAVTQETIASWNPDVIVFAGSTITGTDTAQQTLAKLAADPFWGNQPAIRNKRAHINPTGAFLWDRYGVEEALQVEWAAKTLNPDLFTGLDIVQETRTFYHDFLHYDLTNAEATRIVNAQDPE